MTTRQTVSTTVKEYDEEGRLVNETTTVSEYDWPSAQSSYVYTHPWRQYPTTTWWGPQQQYVTTGYASTATNTETPLFFGHNTVGGLHVVDDTDGDDGEAVPA